MEASTSEVRPDIELQKGFTATSGTRGKAPEEACIPNSSAEVFVKDPVAPKRENRKLTVKIYNGCMLGTDFIY